MLVKFLSVIAAVLTMALLAVRWFGRGSTKAEDNTTLRCCSRCGVYVNSRCSQPECPQP